MRNDRLKAQRPKTRFTTKNETIKKQRNNGGRGGRVGRQQRRLLPKELPSCFMLRLWLPFRRSALSLEVAGSGTTSESSVLHEPMSTTSDSASMKRVNTAPRRKAVGPACSSSPPPTTPSGVNGKRTKTGAKQKKREPFVRKKPKLGAVGVSLIVAFLSMRFFYHVFERRVKRREKKQNLPRDVAFGGGERELQS